MSATGRILSRIFNDTFPTFGMLSTTITIPIIMARSSRSSRCRFPNVTSPKRTDVTWNARSSTTRVDHMMGRWRRLCKSLWGSIPIRRLVLASDHGFHWGEGDVSIGFIMLLGTECVLGGLCAYTMCIF